MIQLTSISLDKTAAHSLNQWQSDIDSIPSYAEQVAAAKIKFSALNVSTNKTFAHVREILSVMCQGPRRCAYCEDSAADEVEHVQPKDLYPDMVFKWDNYVYACGPCNGPKNNQFAILDGPPLRLNDITRRRGQPVTPPPSGPPALINPRQEDPLHFLFLDLQNTFAFTPRLGISSADNLRAEYTIQVLRLNSRDYLTNARSAAFGNYRARLSEYINEKLGGAKDAVLSRRQHELQKVGHRTVWKEMQRQHRQHKVLLQLFSSAPEALLW